MGARFTRANARGTILMDIAAGAILVALPTLFVYVLLQRQFVRV
jgi:ABC-type glycerol-3-phosphate transport system permease component